MSSVKPILYLCYGFPVVSETFISDQVEALIQAGMPVKVLAMTGGNNAQRTAQWHANPAHAGVLEVMYPQGISKVAALLSLPFTLLRMIKRPQSWRLSLFCLRSCTGVFAQASLIARWLDKHPQQGSVLMCHFGTIGYMGALLKAWGCLDPKMPQVSVFHGFDISKILRGKPDGFYKPLFASPNHTSLTITKFWQDTLRSLGDPAPVLIKLGVDLTRVDYAPRTYPESRPVRFISVGRLTAKKGYLYTLDAFARLPKELAWDYTIIGAGPQEADLRAKAESLGLQGKVKLLGARPHSETLQHLQQADAFVLASHTAPDGDMEALPLALLEAAATGMPVVTSSHSAIPEFFRDGETGLVAREHDTASLTEKLQTLITKPDIWPKLTENARRDMESTQDFHKHIQVFLGFVKELSQRGEG